MPSPLRISTRINGRLIERSLEPHLLLGDFLRTELGLTGTKISCDLQICGACTVLIDGEPISACTTLALEADGKSVLTIEGMANGDQLDPIQQAFVDFSALQCGFCTPGMIMAIKALVTRTPEPTRSQVQHWLEGNICRCGTYGAILDAVSNLKGAR